MKSFVYHNHYVHYLVMTAENTLLFVFLQPSSVSSPTLSPSMKIIIDKNSVFILKKINRFF